jgi:enolase
MKKTVIENLKIRRIVNSRGQPTVEVDVITVGGTGRSAAPSGVSVGKKEAVALPKDIDALIEDTKKMIIPELIGMDSAEQQMVDETLREIDGTGNFSRIGGSIAVAISLAVSWAAANSHNEPLFRYLGGSLRESLPYPLGKVIGGGVHTGKNAPDIQEFLVIPTGAKSIKQAISVNSLVHKKVKELIYNEDKTFTGCTDQEGGWAPNMSNEDALDIVTEAAESTKNETGVEVSLGLDMAANSFYKRGKYVYRSEGNKARDSGEQMEYVCELVDRYNLFYVEDAFQEDDMKSFAELTKKEGKKCMICGDDVFVTNKGLLKKGISVGACNSIIIKPNQIGTLTNMYETVDYAKEHGYVPVISHRSGETTDTSIAHLAVAFRIPVIKTGIVGGERIAKLNELIRIEEQLEMPVMAEL